MVLTCRTKQVPPPLFLETQTMTLLLCIEWFINKTFEIESENKADKDC